MSPSAGKWGTGDHRQAAGDEPLLLGLQHINCAVSVCCDRGRKACWKRGMAFRLHNHFTCSLLTQLGNPQLTYSQDNQDPACAPRGIKDIKPPQAMAKHVLNYMIQALSGHLHRHRCCPP